MMGILNENAGFSSTQKTALYLAIILTPLAITLFLLGVMLQSNLRQYHPAWSDEVIYWQEIVTFKEVGFSGGYFSIGENIAPSEFSHFGTHGPIFPLIYGSLARILGWTRASGPIFNLIFISMALVFFLWLCKPNKRQSIFLLLVTISFYPLLLYLPTTMQESLIQAIAIVLAAFIIRLSIGKPAGFLVKVLAIIALTAACLVKVTFALAAFPIMFLILNRRTVKWFLLSIIISIAFSYVMYGIFNSWTSPYPDWVFYQVSISNLPIGDLIKLVGDHAAVNLAQFFAIPGTDQPIEVVFRYQYFALMIFCMVFFKRNKALLIPASFLLFSIFALTILVYDVKWFRDYRALAPILLIALFCVCFCIETTIIRRVLTVYLISNLLTLGLFLPAYRDMHLNQFAAEWDAEEKVYSEPLSRLEYKISDDPWCNSVLSLHPSGENIGSIQPGLGINLLLDPNIDMEKIRSHYLYVTVDFLERQGLSDSCQPIFIENGRIICERVDDGCR